MDNDVIETQPWVCHCGGTLWIPKGYNGSHTCSHCGAESIVVQAGNVMVLRKGDK